MFYIFPELALKLNQSTSRNYKVRPATGNNRAFYAVYAHCKPLFVFSNNCSTFKKNEKKCKNYLTNPKILTIQTKPKKWKIVQILNKS